MSRTGRPNQFNSLIEEAVGAAVKGGTTLAEVMESHPALTTGQLSSRGLNYAALRMVREGKLARRYEFTGAENGHPVRRYRYWLPEYAPADSESA